MSYLILVPCGYLLLSWIVGPAIYYIGNLKEDDLDDYHFMFFVVAPPLGLPLVAYLALRYGRRGTGP